MNSWIAKLRRCICSEVEEGGMELNLFKVLCLASVLLSLFVVIPTNILHHLPPFISAVVAVFVCFVLLLLRLSCRGRYHVKTLFFLLLALLNIIWFPNGGSEGSIGYYFFCIFMYIPIFFRGRRRLLLFVFSLADFALLLVGERFAPQWTVPFETGYYRSADMVVGMAVAAVICSLMIWALVRSYERERERLVALNNDLRENIAERIQVEKLMMENRELLNAVVEGSTDAIFVKDTGGNYLLFNHAAAVMTGKEPAEACGRNDFHLFPPEVAQRIDRMDREIMAANETRIVENRLTTASGRAVICEVIKGPLHDGQGNVIGLFGISRDVTESRRMGEELRKLNEELEMRVAERTAALEAAIREQESFSYSVSHDLRGPLRHINCYTAILDEEFGWRLPPEARQYLERVRGASARMGDLIDDLLELSRIGRSELRKVPVDLSGLASVICRKLQEGEPHRRSEFVVEPGVEVRGDRVLLGQMLENIIGNAWKYSAPRECARIRFGREVVDGREVLFVMDNGVGFDMAYKDKLFGPFQRLHGAEFEGTGIGLATVKRIIERHKGAVWARGEVDGGATIYFTLP